MLVQATKSKRKKISLSLKFSYKKHIVSCKAEPTKYENGRVSKKPNFRPGSFSFSPTIKVSTPENFNKFDLTNPKLNQNVSKLNKTKPNTMSCKALEKDKFKDLKDKISGEKIAFPENIKVQSISICNIFLQFVFEQPLSLENALGKIEKNRNIKTKPMSLSESISIRKGVEKATIKSK